MKIIFHQVIDVVLVGPWSRVIDEFGLDKYRLYISSLRESESVGSIIYSSSDELGVVPNDLFDIVIANSHIKSSSSGDGCQNLNSYNYVLNSWSGIKAAKSEKVLRMRSDLMLKDPLKLINQILATNLVIVDYSPNHTLLIPYYLPDFLTAGTKEKLLQIFTLKAPSFYANLQKRRVSTLSPLKFLTVRILAKEVDYTEFLIWQSYFSGKNTRVSMLDLNLKIWVDYIKNVKEKIILIDRFAIFKDSSRFRFISSKSIFKNHQLDTSKIYLLLIYHLWLYMRRSIVNASRILFI